MYDITTKTKRDKLEVRQEPYWYPLGNGTHLGFRWFKEKASSGWIVQWRDRTGKRRFESLGSHADFNSAKVAATEKIQQMSAGARRAIVRGTVRAALMGYVLQLRKHGRRSAAQEARKRFALTVGKDDPLRMMKLGAATYDDMEEWRARLSPGREPRSVNRQVRSVVAALNWAVSPKGGYAGNAKAWKFSALDDEGEESRPVFLSPEQRQRIIAASPPALAALLTGYAHLGCRPSELEKAIVADFDPDAGTVKLRHRKGRGGKLRARTTELSTEGVAFFKGQARDKLPKAPLISSEAGVHWDDQRRCGGIQKAIKAVNDAAKKPAEKIPDRASAYSFRHSFITEVLKAGGVNPVEVAISTGTSVAMIEKHYWKFIPGSLRAKLDEMKKSA